MGSRGRQADCRQGFGWGKSDDDAGRNFGDGHRVARAATSHLRNGVFPPIRIGCFRCGNSRAIGAGHCDLDDLDAHDDDVLFSGDGCGN